MDFVEAKHAAILASETTMIHAMEGAAGDRGRAVALVAAAYRRCVRVSRDGALMATLALAVAGAAAGSAVLPAGVSLFAATLTGVAIGSQIGALGGSVIDQALLGSSGRTRHLEGPRARASQPLTQRAMSLKI
jgi:phage tail tape-measure protein